MSVTMHLFDRHRINLNKLAYLSGLQLLSSLLFLRDSKLLAYHTLLSAKMRRY